MYPTSWKTRYPAPVITLHVNSERREALDPRRNLLSYLRFDLGQRRVRQRAGHAGRTAERLGPDPLAGLAFLSWMR